MSEKKQYFYLVAISTNKAPETYVVPKKITLQEYEAVKYGRRLATELQNDSLNNKVRLYRQSITRNGNIEFIKELKPFIANSEFIENLARFNSTYGRLGNKSNELKVYEVISPGHPIRYGLGEVPEEALHSIEPIISIPDCKYDIRVLKPEDYVITPNNRFIVIKGESVSGTESLYEFNGKWRTGLYFAGHHCECWHLDYDNKDQAEQDYRYLLNRFGE